jgi:CheY-like chemotaxis protein
MPKIVYMLEDDSDDRYLTEEILREAGVDIPIRFFNNSDALFEALQTGNKPSLLLVDYNIAPENGIAVLKKLKSQQHLTTFPVVVLSDNDLPHYKNECYAHGASSFIKKPSSLETSRQKITSFFNYWFEVAEV